jgi:hypothetical protein
MESALDDREVASRSPRGQLETNGQNTFNLEATMEHMLQQMASSLRKDMDSREERLVQRIETERKEQQTALFEVQRSLTTQQANDMAAHEDRFTRRVDSERRETKAMFTDLRHEEQRAQIANLREDLNILQTQLTKFTARSPSTVGSLGADTNGSSALDKEIAELRREFNGQREQSQLNTRTVDAAIGDIRHQLLALHGADVRSVQDQFINQLGGSAAGAEELSALRCLIDETKGGIGRIGNDLAAERSERNTALAAVSCRAEDAVSAVQRLDKIISEQVLGRLRAFENRAPSFDGASLTASESVSMAGITDRVASSKPEARGDAEDQVALSLCIGELDAELRKDLHERINGVVSEMRKDIASSVGALEVEFRQLVSSTGILSRIEARVIALEEARLDLRIVKLEGAAQHSAVFTDSHALLDGTANNVERMQSLGMYEDNYLRGRGFEQPGVGDDLDVSQRMWPQEDPPLDAAGARIEGRLDAPLSYHGPDDAEQINFQQMMAQLAEVEAVTASADGREPLISDDLKERLETLVQQVKATLNASPTDALGDGPSPYVSHLQDQVQMLQRSQTAFSEIPGPSYTAYAPVVSTAPALQTQYGAPPSLIRFPL